MRMSLGGGQLPQRVMHVCQVGLKLIVPAERNRALLQATMSRLQGVRVSPQAIPRANLAIARPGPLLRRTGRPKQPAGQFDKPFVVARAVRDPRISVELLEVDVPRRCVDIAIP